MLEKACLSLIIYGRVHGVFFRLKTKRKAEELGLTGWVKNNADGTVEILAEGNKLDLENLLEWCKKGPRLAKVEKIKIRWQPYTGDLERFEII
ncbi:MAG TPA: acylphosphatase [Candidatus Uhrbacteria bacterium]|nr:acylphosphatase [Candidatus Uhrbacteria bacterium]